MLELMSSLNFLIFWAFTVNCADFKKEVLNLHNNFRKIHGVPPLTLDDGLSDKAALLVDRAIAQGNLTKAQPGENTYMLCTSYNRGVTAEEAVSAWYDEVCSDGFSFSDPNNDNAHAFTQAVWKDSSRIGVAKSTANDVGTDGLKCTFVVALYRPPGNIELTGAKDRDELFRENIFKGSFKASYCDKFNDFRKRELVEETKLDKKVHGRTKRTISDDSGWLYHNTSEEVHHLSRRALYYKIPAKFYIDSETGRTKIVSALGEKIASHLDGSSLLSAENEKEVVSVIDPDSRGLSNEQNANAEEFDDGLVSSDDASLAPAPVSETNAASAESRAVIGAPYDQDNERDRMLSIALRVHNMLRQIHGSKPLRISAELSRAAEAQAAQNAAMHTLVHASDLGILLQGENLAYNCKGENEVSLIQDSIRDWYNEVCRGPYDFSSEEDGHDALHFTQVIWNSTRLLGCGKAVSKRSIAGSTLTCTYFCCRYGPTGNMYGEFQKNVLKGSFDRDSTCPSLPGNINVTANIPGIYLDINENTGSKVSTNSSAPVDRAKIRKHDDQVAKQETKLQVDALNTHNFLRRLHGSQPLVLDENLSKNAKRWAKYIAATDTLKHSKADDYGENIAYSCSGNKIVASVNDSVNDWYDEVCAHEYNFLSDMQPDTLHFTQVLWNDSSRLGIGMATSINKGMYCTYFVAQYKPKGNIIGQFTKNIAKGEFDTRRGCLGLRNIVPIVENITQDNSKEGNTSSESVISKVPLESVPLQSVKSSEDLQDQDENDYEFDAVKVLNKIRQFHEAPAIVEDPDLHMDARDRAAAFVTGSVKMVKNQSHVGEIVQVACNPLNRVLPPEEAIANWYSEVCVKDYKFDNYAPQHAFHFTQLIWNSSKRIGIAYATKKKKNGHLCTVVIALFEPGGNVENEYAKNIRKGTFDKSFCGSINSIAVSALDGDSSRMKGHSEWIRS